MSIRLNDILVQDSKMKVFIGIQFTERMLSTNYYGDPTSILGNIYTYFLKPFCLFKSNLNYCLFCFDFYKKSTIQYICTVHQILQRTIYFVYYFSQSHLNITRRFKATLYRYMSYLIFYVWGLINCSFFFKVMVITKNMLIQFPFTGLIFENLMSKHFALIRIYSLAYNTHLKMNRFGSALPRLIFWYMKTNKISAI